MNHYEQSGIIFLKENIFFTATNFFCRAIESEPENAMSWFLLGENFIKLRELSQIDDLYWLGIACLKKSYELDGNEFSNNILKIHDSNDLNKISTANLEMILKFKVEIEIKKMIEDFSKFQSEDNKIALVIHLGETKNISFFEFLKYCISNELNPHIRFAALKRIPFYKNQDLQFFFEDLISKNLHHKLEPYFSMSLKNIDEDWSKELIKDSKIDFNQYDKTINHIKQNLETENTNEKDSEDEINAMIYMSLSRFKFSEIKNYVDFKNNKMLVMFLTTNMMQSGIDLLIKHDIVNPINKEITKHGWEKINRFIEKQTEILNESKAKIEEEKVTEKWWKFW